MDEEELLAIEESDVVDGDGDSSDTFKNKRIEDQLKKKTPEQNTLKFTNANRLVSILILSITGIAKI